MTKEKIFEELRVINMVIDLIERHEIFVVEYTKYGNRLLKEKLKLEELYASI